MLLVTAYNQGERPVHLMMVGLDLSNGREFVMPWPAPPFPRLPFVVTDTQPYSSAFDLDNLRANLQKIRAEERKMSA